MTQKFTWVFKSNWNLLWFNAVNTAGFSLAQLLFASKYLQDGITPITVLVIFLFLCLKLDK